MAQTSFEESTGIDSIDGADTLQSASGCVCIYHIYQYHESVVLPTVYIVQSND